MNWLIAASVAVLLIIGSLIALAWWKLAARMAPYRDEDARRAARSHRHDAHEVVVIDRRGGTGGPA